MSPRSSGGGSTRRPATIAGNVKKTSPPSSDDLATPRRRSPRLLNSIGVNKQFISPVAASVSSLEQRLEGAAIGKKRRSSTAITPLRLGHSGIEGKDGADKKTPLQQQNPVTSPLRQRQISFLLPLLGRLLKKLQLTQIRERHPAHLLSCIALTRTLSPRSVDSGFQSSGSQENNSNELLGLPDHIIATYKERRKINTFYDWQMECLSNRRVVDGDNVILSLPTGAGKTLIAELLILRELLVYGRNAILVLPYVAIVQEKMTSLSTFEDAFPIHVEEYAANKGRLPPLKRRGGTPSVYVATIEKANMLINSLIENDRLKDIGLVVIDELHMIGEGSRGACIESLLCKFRYRGRGQIVGISATLTNMEELKRFLNAFVYSTQFRPVELLETVRIGQRMLKVVNGRLEPLADLPPNKMAAQDPDGICQLLQQVIPLHSAIVFCPTKKNCENVAALIAKAVPKAVRDHKKAEKRALIEMIREESEGGEQSLLEKCVEAGIAWHHSGLTHDERKHIEAAFIAGTLCVVCATSTLAAGVNLPARRVIIKAPMVGRDRLGKAQYLQMIGRAGRAGFDDKGEAVTIIRPGAEENTFRAMLLSAEMRCESALKEAQLLEALVLDLISLKLATTVDVLHEILEDTLLRIQKGEEHVREMTRRVLDALKSESLIEEGEEDGALCVTEVGSATFTASVPPSRASTLNHNLVRTLSTGVNFSSHLHLLFLIVPYDVGCTIDWDLFYKEFCGLSESEKVLLEATGVSMKRILAQITTRKQLESGETAMRLYIALMLQHVWNHEPHSSVSSLFSVDRGWLQSTLQSTLSHASSVARFAERLPSSLWPLRLLLPELVSRLCECSRPELLPLMQIDLVKRSRAAQLHAAGYKTVADVSCANVDVMCREVDNLGRYQACKIVQSAKALLRDQFDEKMEEIEAMGITPQINSFSLTTNK